MSCIPLNAGTSSAHTCSNREERRIETADQIACTGRLFGGYNRGGPLEREVLKNGPEYGVAEDMGMAQISAAAGNGRSRHPQFALSRVFVPFDICHRVLRNEQDQHKPQEPRKRAMLR